jgi:hypothetical protein
VYIVSGLFVLFLLVICIWIDLQVHKELGLRIYTKSTKPCQAKLLVTEACKGVPSQRQQWRRIFDQSMYYGNETKMDLIAAAPSTP